MLRLVLFRHAKSSWAYPELSDFERPLNERGRRDAPLIAARLVPVLGKKYMVLSSPACRAATTARLAMQQWKKSDTAIIYRAELYHASLDALWQVITTQSSECSTLVVFGHNEGLTELAERCSKGKLAHLPTAAVAVFDFEAEGWSDIQQDFAQLVHYDFPKKA